MMALLSNVLLAPLAPVRGVLWLTKLLAELATDELADPETLRARLREAEEAHRRGDISADELEQIEDAVVTRLVELQGARGGVS